MASTYSKNAAGLEELSDADLLKYLTLLLGYQERLENKVRSSSDVRDKAMYEGQLKTRRDALDFTAKMEGINSRNAIARLQAAAKVEATAIKSVEDYATKYAKPYSRIEDAAKARGRIHATPGRVRFGNVMGVLIQRATAPGMTFDKYNPKFLRTFESVVADADPAGEFFIRDPKTGEVTGLTNQGKKLTGMKVDGGDSFTTQTIAGDSIESLWNDYESLNTTFKKQTRLGNETLENAQELRKRAMEATTGSDSQLKLIAAYDTQMQKYFNLTFKKYNIGDLESVQERVNAATAESSTYKTVGALINQLMPGILKAGKTSSKMGMYVSNPKFQQWAKDHGFESIGTGKKEDDGSWSYNRGGDDEKAFDLYLAQRKKGKFDYGFMRGASTGETVQVTLKDGTTLSGERGKVHSSDLKNIIRILTPDGIEFLNTDEDIEGDVVILEDAPEKKGIREKLAGRRAKSREERTEELVSAAAEDAEGVIEDVATVGEQYVQDEAGRYLSQDEYDQRKEALLKAQRSGHAKMVAVGGKPYLYASGEVYEVSKGEGNTVDAELVEDAAVIAAVTAEKGDLLLIKDGEAARYGTKADFSGGDLKFDSVISPEDETYGSLSEAAEETFTAGASDEALGVQLTDDPGYVSEERGERAGVGARTPRVAEHLPEDPDEPEVEVPAKPWNPDDLDRDQRDSYDAMVARIKHTYKPPTAFDQKRLDQLEDKTRLSNAEAAELNRLQSAVPELKRRDDAIDTAMDVLNKLYSPLLPDEEVPDQDETNRAFGSVGITKIVDEVPAPAPKPAPTGSLSKTEMGAFQSPRTDPRVFSQLAERLKADPATTSFTMGESLEVVDPATKKRKLTDLMKQRRAVRPGAIVQSSKDLGKLMQVTKDKDVDVYETDEGLYMAMQKGQPLPAGRAGRLLTDIKAPKPAGSTP